MRVPLEAWQVGPWNRWAYQHVDEVVPTVLVPRGTGTVRPLPEAPAPAPLDDLAAALLEPAFADGLAVLHGGALVLERYANGMDATTRHLGQSVSKSVLGLLVGVLCGRGALDPDARVTDHVPEVAASGYAGATVRHLLDMTAAVDFVEDYAAGFWRYDVACGWHPPHPDAPARTILEFLPTIGPAAWAHGERFHYASPTSDLLGVVAERAGGAPLAELLARELWIPLGAEADAELAVDPAGTAVISGGVCATVRDLARLGTLVLGDGLDVVPAPWVAGLGRGDPAAFARVTVPETTAGAYATQWWTVDGRTAARGIHGQLVTVDRAARVVVVILSSWPDAVDARLLRAQLGFVAAVTERLVAG